MRVLVTGSLGYIGVVLAPLLQDGGHEVTGLDVDLYSGCIFETVLPRARPRWGAHSGAEQLYAPYRHSPLSQSQFKGPRHQRIGRLRGLLEKEFIGPDLPRRAAGGSPRPAVAVPA